MALIKCPECGREKVSDTALACPDCGFGIKEYVEKERLKKLKEEEKENERLRAIELEKERQRKKEEKNKRKNNKTVIISSIVAILFISFLSCIFFNINKSNDNNVEELSPLEESYKMNMNRARYYIVGAIQLYNEYLVDKRKSWEDFPNSYIENPIYDTERITDCIVTYTKEKNKIQVYLYNGAGEWYGYDCYLNQSNELIGGSVGCTVKERRKKTDNYYPNKPYDSFYTSALQEDETYDEWMYFIPSYDISSINLNYKSSEQPNSIYNDTKVQDEHPQLGMTKDEVLKTKWGEPNKKNISEYSWGTFEQWCYSGDRYVYFDDGIVSSIDYNE